MSRIVPQLPNSALTSNSVAVPTTTGFSAGDLVYFNGNNGNYGTIPNAAIASASVDIVQNSPTYNGNTLNSFYQFHNPISYTTDFQGGNSSKQASAILTNGNIVTVWCQNSPTRAVFQIKTTAGVVVVPATVATTAYTPYSGTGFVVSVVALSGGGFVMFFTMAASPQSLVYAVYNNSGTVVTAWQTDVSYGTFTSASTLSGVALPNGRFVLSRYNDSSLVNYRIYEANGTGAFPAVTAPVAANGVQGNVGMAARSDNSFLLFYPAVNANTMQYIIVSSTNTVITTASFTGGVNQRADFCGVTCLTNDTFVLAFQYRDATNSIINPFMRLIPVGNTLGSEIAVGPASLQLLNFNTGTIYADINVKNLSSGGFICAWSNTDGSVNYNFFNSLGQVISATSGNYPRQIISFGIQNYNQIDLLEYNGAVVISAISAGPANTLYYPYVRVSTTDFNIIPNGSVSSILGSVSVATGNYLPSASTPSSATFISATSAISDATVPLSSTSSFVVSPSTIQSINCNTIASTTLANGNFVIVTKQSSNSVITAFAYTPSGGLLQTIPVGTGVGDNISLVKVAAMSDGGFVVSYYTNVSNPSSIKNQVYSFSSNSYGLANTTEITGIATGVNNSFGLGLCGLSNNRFAVAYFENGSTNPIFRVYSSAGAQLFQSFNIGFGTGTNVNIISDPVTGTNIGLSFFRNNISGYSIMMWRETSLNNWSNFASASFTGNTATTNSNCMYLPNGNILTGGANGTSGAFTVRTPSSGSLWGISGQTLINNTSGTWAVGCTGYGTIVSFALQSGSTATVRVMSSTLFNNTMSITDNSYNLPGAGGGNVGVTAGIGYRAILTYLNDSGFPTFAIINAYPFVQTGVVVAGVTPTTPTPLLPNKFVLAGVAANTATAGGSGNVIVNGNAALNANYSASTPAGAFDFQNPGTFGVKGTIAGRNVNLQGNNS